MPKISLLALVTGTVLSGVFGARAEPIMHRHDMQQHSPAIAATQDHRTIVVFPEPMRRHTLANMRDHLLALQQIQEALAEERYEAAGDIAEQRLGMSALTQHGAHESAQYMPGEMQDIGSGMHRAASRFAIAARDTSVTGDVNPALGQLAQVTKQCVACHNAYRLQ